MRNLRTRLAAILVMLTATAMLCGAADRPKIYKPATSETMMICGMSDNGKYVVSQDAGSQEVDNPQPSGGTLYNLDTRQATTIPAPMGSAGVADVADNGTVAGSCDGIPAY